MQTDAEVAAIAAWVRAGDHDWPLECEGEFFGMPLGASIMRPLVRRGLFDRIERKGFQTRWAITRLGDRVAQHLKQENSRG